MDIQRFDLAYETMPWHKVDAVVFDIGNVLIRFAPDDFIAQLFPGDEAKQREMMARVFKGPYWLDFDRGVIDYDTAAARLAQQFGGDVRDYLHAMRGWIELKTPIEEGWRAVARCRRAGKRLYLLSNYGQEAYERLREKFAGLFDAFDGGVISCYEHVIKPEAAIYDTLKGRYGLAPGRALFIDDTLANVQAGMDAGIHGFHMDENGKMDRFFL